jgi:choline-glycine betaine transporter
LGLLYVGGLKAIQTAVILFGFPILVLLTIMCGALLKAFHKEVSTGLTSSPTEEVKEDFTTTLTSTEIQIKPEV